MSVRRRLVAVLATLAAAALVIPLLQGHATAAPIPVNGYIALGDSVPDAYGVADKDGYVALLSDALGGLPTRNASVSGATTTSLIEEQLPRVLPSIAARNGNRTPVDDVGLITITIGGNDVFAPVVGACAGGVDLTCLHAVQTVLAGVSVRYEHLLDEVRAAAGPNATIAVMTYYNALVGSCYLTREYPGIDVLAQLVLEGGLPGVTLSLNGVIRDAAAGVDAVVVETGGVVGPEELVGGQDCLHPNEAGHAAIADAFAAVLAETG
ncbi:MAG: SGNH/GDSL hydrolase family protein [Actinomycetes bacterium]